MKNIKKIMDITKVITRKITDAKKQYTFLIYNIYNMYTGRITLLILSMCGVLILSGCCGVPLVPFI